MPNRSDLTTAFTAVEQAIREAPAAEVPTLLGELERVKAIGWGRLVTPATPLPGPQAGESEQGALTQEEVAARYRIPLRTVRRLTRTGRLPSYQLGRNRMVRPADVDRYLTRCRAQEVPVGTILDG